MPIFFPMTGNEALASDLASLTAGEVGQIQLRHFPDGETYVRILSDVKGRDAFLVCTLARPDPKFLQLAFTASTVRGLGAATVKLIAPYLAYMRQDRIFHPGEALTSRAFAELISRHFDGLVTVDPHLHRRLSLDEVYDINSTVVHAAPLFARWIETHVEAPFVIGPDRESEQWVEGIARDAGAPWTVFEKERRGDRKVHLHSPNLHHFRDRTPVLVDDILSSGATMLQAIRLLREENFECPYCLAVHSLCSAATARRIRDNSAGFLTSNTIANPDWAFDVAPLIADALVETAAMKDSASRPNSGRSTGQSPPPKTQACSR